MTSLERCRAAASKPMLSKSTASARVSGAVYSMNSNPSVPAGLACGASMGSPVSVALVLPAAPHASRMRGVLRVRHGIAAARLSAARADGHCEEHSDEANPERPSGFKKLLHLLHPRFR